MNELRSTIYELLVKAQEAYGTLDAIRYKVKEAGDGGKKETKVAAKTYTQLRQDSEHFSAALNKLGEQGSISLLWELLLTPGLRGITGS